MAGRVQKITALVLAAGLSERMGANKLLTDLGGKPLIRYCVDMLLASPVQDVVVVTGNEAKSMRKTLASLAVKTVHNPHFADGLSSSLKCGLAAVSADADGVLVCLGDMPLVTVQTVDRLVSAFSPDEHRSICVPTHEGIRGNPVLWGRQHFIAIEGIEGDQGGRLLLDALSDEVVEVEVKTKAVLVDVDTPDALQEVKSILKL